MGTLGDEGATEREDGWSGTQEDGRATERTDGWTGMGEDGWATEREDGRTGTQADKPATEREDCRTIALATGKLLSEGLPCMHADIRWSIFLLAVVASPPFRAASSPSLRSGGDSQPPVWFVIFYI